MLPAIKGWRDVSLADHKTEAQSDTEHSHSTHIKQNV